MVSIQAMINMGVVSGVLPVTGITLPFISYGGTSLVFTMLGVGVLLNISREVR
jgi:cell division protein FtsW